MSSFTEKLSITQISSKPRRWRVDKSFRFYIGKKDSHLWVDILEGFICDGGSMPRCVWWLDSPIGFGAASYFLHDGLYQAWVGPRALCDITMLEGLQVLGMGWTRRSLIYNQVWMWGWKAYNDKTHAGILEARQFVKASFPMMPLPELPLLTPPAIAGG